MEGSGVIIPTQDMLLPDNDEITTLELNKVYKVIYKHKNSFGNLIGKLDFAKDISNDYNLYSLIFNKSL